MNVLIFVITMLMILTMLTYGRVQTFRTSQIYGIFFNHYMEQDERGYINVAMEKAYLKTKASQKPGGQQAAPAKSSSRVSLALLVDKKKRQSQSKEWELSRLLFKNLIDVLYSDSPFYQNAIERNPQVVDQLLDALQQAVDAMPEDKKIKKATELANINLSDSKLNELFYKMLLGAPKKDITGEENVDCAEPKKPPQEDNDDAALEGEANEYKSPAGYYSVLDFINLSQNIPIRVYLAPKEVLLASFNKSEAVVEEIMLQREALYKQAIADGDVGELTMQFKDLFIGKRDPALDEKMVDFTVSKTKPKS